MPDNIQDFIDEIEEQERHFRLEIDSIVKAIEEKAPGLQQAIRNAEMAHALYIEGVLVAMDKAAGFGDD